MDRRKFLTMCAASCLLASAHATDTGEPPSNSHAMVITPKEAHVYSQGLGEAHILVDTARSNGTWWLGQFREDPGFTTSLHLHPVQTEYFFVLDGVLSVFLDGAWHDLKTGTIAEVPNGTPHAQANHDGQPVKFVGWGAPSGFEQAFPAIDKLAARLSPSSPQWGPEAAKIVSRHDTTVLGPPPRRG
jgi:quercetin dioxygenase-like cupin family protein